LFRKKYIFSSVAAIIAIAIIASSAIFYFPTAQLTQPSLTAPPQLDGAFIARTLNATSYIVNNASGTVTLIFARQAPIVRMNSTGMALNNFTLMSTIVEFMLPPAATNNATVYARGIFSLLETEVNPVVRQVLAANWTVLNLHPFNVGDQPKLQFLHWETRGNTNATIANLTATLALTTTRMPPPAPVQTALNATDIATRLGGAPVNGPTAGVMISRQDLNITASSNPAIILNTFASMSTAFEFVALPTTTDMPTLPGSRNVFVMGDFALLDTEVEAVEKILVDTPEVDLWLISNSTISAVHDHMIGEAPKITFVHFSAMGDLDQIITMLNRAIDQTSMKIARNFTATLSGQTWVSRVNPAVNYTVNTTATGVANFQVNRNNTALQYSLNVTGIQNITMAHIHIDTGVVVGPIVVWLYPSNMSPTTIPGTFNGMLAQGVITSANLTGLLTGHTVYELAGLMAAGKTYVVVHTTQNPPGEIRGYINSISAPTPIPTPTATAMPTATPSPTTSPTITPTPTPIAPTPTPTSTTTVMPTPTTSPTTSPTIVPSPSPTASASPPLPRIVTIKIIITQINVIITVDGSSSQTSTLNLKAGDIVNAIMTNTDTRPHCWAITAEPNSIGNILFDAEIGADRPIGPGETGSDTFTVTQAGNFYYVCPSPDSICSGLCGRVAVAP